MESVASNYIQMHSMASRYYSLQYQESFALECPSEDPGFTKLLIDAGIDSISVNPDSFLATKKQVGTAKEASGRLHG